MGFGRRLRLLDDRVLGRPADTSGDPAPPLVGVRGGVLAPLLLVVLALALLATGHDNWALALQGMAVGLAVSASAPLFARLSRRDEPRRWV